MRVAMLVFVLAVYGCGKDSPSAPKHTYVDLSLASEGCNALLCGSVVGNLTAVSAAWQSNDLSLSPGRSVRVEVPAGGAYRAQFGSITCQGQLIGWDFTVNVTSGQATAAPMSCNLSARAG